MRNRHNILFDLDGTLIHSLPGIEETLQATLKSIGENTFSSRLFRPLVGYPLETVFSILLGDGHPDVDIAVSTYRKLYVKLGLPRAHPFEGIPKMLDDLHTEGRPLFVVTARNEEMARKILKNHDIDGYILSVRGEREGDGRDSKGDLVADVLRAYGLPPEDTVMVGDRRFDSEAALANGCAAVGVTYGYGTREELTEGGAGVLVDSPEELAEILKGQY